MATFVVYRSQYPVRSAKQQTHEAPWALVGTCFEPWQHAAQTLEVPHIGVGEHWAPGKLRISVPWQFSAAGHRRIANDLQIS